MTQEDKKIIDEMAEYARQVREEDDKDEIKFLRELQAELNKAEDDK